MSVQDEIVINASTIHTVPKTFRDEFMRKFPTSYKRILIESGDLPMPRQTRTYKHGFDYHMIEYLRSKCSFQEHEIDELRKKDKAHQPGDLMSHQVIDILRNNCQPVTGISWSDICSPRRFRSIVVVRHVVAYLMLTQTGMSLPAIGRRLGGRDHSTIHNARLKVDEYLNMTDEEKETTQKKYGPPLKALKALLM